VLALEHGATAAHLFAEPTNVRAMQTGRRQSSSKSLRANGREPPRLMNINAIRFVATAACGSIPNSIITGTVINTEQRY
jgi:hypothetical protein